MPHSSHHACQAARFGRRLALTLGLLAGAAILSQSLPAQAQNAEGFLKGKTVRFVVGYSPGGGYDTYARMLAPHFEKRTGATVVVENKPGGGCTTSLNQTYRAKPDGLTMQMLNGEGMVMAQLTKRPGVTFDMTKLSLYGRVAEEPHFFLVNSKLPDSLKDIIASGKKLKFSANNRVDNLGDYAAITCEALKMKCQVIGGYKGSKEAGLAVMNGEVDALTISESSGIAYSSGGKTKIVVAIARKRSALRPDVPTVYEMFKLTPEQKWWFDFRLAIKSVGRMVIGPPGMEADKLAYLQKVWKEILTDPAVIAEGKKSRHEIDYAAPTEVRAALKEALTSITPEQLKKVNEVLFKKYGS
jgi:tripartite-type tricarboxylate transporter receptor subunit TctC